MAGNYPDVPGHRFALDKDGSQVYAITSAGVISQLTPTQVAAFNNEAADNPLANFTYATIVIYFPELRNLTGYMALLQSYSGPILGVEVSSDTTTGVDGTWTAVANGVQLQYAPVITPLYRTNITSISQNGVRAFRIRVTTNSDRNWTGGIHLYGEIPLASNPDRVVFWHPTLDQPLDANYLNLGDTPRLSSTDRTFRIKNISASQTAQSITVNFDALTDASPSMVDDLGISTDGTTFTSSTNIGNLAPGAISSVLTSRLALAADTPLGVWAPRMHAVVGSWV